jgi:hypothetical protein
MAVASGLTLQMPAARAAGAQGGQWTTAPIVLAGREYVAEWALPDGPAAALVTVQHGFQRECANVRDTALKLMDAGLMTLCVNAPMAGGNPALADALAVALASGAVAVPDGRALPAVLIAGGHSAGGHFASRLGATLSSLAPQRFAGLMLFDPVAAAGFEANLQAASAGGLRPIRTVSANPGACNAQNNAYPALASVQQAARLAGRDDFVGVQLIDRSTHIDVEGQDTDWLAVTACMQGTPTAANVATLRTLAARWSTDMAVGRRSAAWYPGGVALEALVSAGRAEVIRPAQ